MMQPATIAVPASAVPLPQPPVQPAVSAVKQLTPSRPLLPEPLIRETEQVSA